MNVAKKFYRTSQKLNGQPKTQLNKQPTVKTDLYIDKKLQKKGSVARDERLNDKPMPVKKHLEKQDNRSKFKGTKKTLQRKNKGQVKKFL